MSQNVAAGVAAGNVNIIATSTEDSTISQTFALIIEEKVPEVILPESISLTSTGNVTTFKAGETLELTAVVYPVEASLRFLLTNFFGQIFFKQLTRFLRTNTKM